MAKDCEDMYDRICKDNFTTIFKKLDKIQENTNHYSRRPSWGVCLVITALTGMVIFLAQYIITH